MSEDFFAARLRTQHTKKKLTEADDIRVVEKEA